MEAEYLKLKVVNEKRPFCRIPATMSIAETNAMKFTFDDDEAVKLVMAWDGECSIPESDGEMCVELPFEVLERNYPGFPASAPDYVCVSVLLSIPSAVEVFLSPVTSLDWEMIQSSPGRIEEELIHDVPLVQVGHRISVSVSARIQANAVVDCIKTDGQELAMDEAAWLKGDTFLIIAPKETDKRAVHANPSPNPNPNPSPNRVGKGEDDALLVNSKAAVQTLSEYRLRVLPTLFKDSCTNPCIARGASGANRAAGDSHVNDDDDGDNNGDNNAANLCALASAWLKSGTGAQGLLAMGIGSHGYEHELCSRFKCQLHPAVLLAAAQDAGILCTYTSTEEETLAWLQRQVQEKALLGRITAARVSSTSTCSATVIVTLSTAIAPFHIWMPQHTREQLQVGDYDAIHLHLLPKHPKNKSSSIVADRITCKLLCGIPSCSDSAAGDGNIEDDDGVPSSEEVRAGILRLVEAAAPSPMPLACGDFIPLGRRMLQISYGTCCDGGRDREACSHGAADVVMLHADHRADSADDDILVEFMNRLRCTGTMHTKQSGMTRTNTRHEPLGSFPAIHPATTASLSSSPTPSFHSSHFPGALFGIEGSDEVVHAMAQDLASSLMRTAVLERLDIRDDIDIGPPLGALLTGGPLCGKSTLAHGMASIATNSPQCLAYTEVLSLRTLTQDMRGSGRVSEAALKIFLERLEAVFHRVRVNAPSLLVLDDLDELCPADVAEVEANPNPNPNPNHFPHLTLTNRNRNPNPNSRRRLGTCPPGDS